MAVKLTALQASRQARNLRQLDKALASAEQTTNVLRSAIGVQWRELRSACPHPPEHRGLSVTSIETFEVCRLCGWSSL